MAKRKLSDEDKQQARELGARLCQVRTERKLDQGKLGEMAGGMDQTAISRYECGRSMPGTRQLKALALALDTTTEWLLFGDAAATIPAK